MLELEPLINGREYGWADIICTIGGVPVTGIVAIKYEEEQEKENVYGAGRHPVSRGYGRIKTTASITVLASTAMALTHILKNCEFQKTPFEWKEGDMHKEVELPLIVSHVVDKSI